MLRFEQKLDTHSGGDGDALARRASIRRSSALAMPRARGVHAVDRTIPGPVGPVPVRVYRSTLARAQPPALVYLHGGGWVVGDLDTHDGSCRILTTHSTLVSGPVPWPSWATVRGATSLLRSAC